ncbi:peptidoglycan recognition protein family protein [Roseburia sp. 499]|uniref:peptidoglycan recognition protein family protein n=1 Tax=Roseburia sp. 499 TaxID=1261634 RepID=UPI000952E5BE|nr:peptidoglycan recognition family protein [Roseburia sp. 499]WVK70747.1 peptidoglycan recognition family protein [Roseburia sp. 499]
MTSEERRRREACLARRRKRKRKRILQMVRKGVISCGAVLVVVLVIIHISQSAQASENISEQSVDEMAEDFKQKVILEAPDYQVELLTPNEYSRPQIAMDEVRGIVIHYTANPGTTAEQNRSYFESLKDSHETKASSHFVVGIDGEIVQCIPSSEISYASNDRNNDTISIECCHLNKDGKFTQETYDSLVHLTAWLCGKFDVPVENVIRHYDVTGKECPLYYVEHEDAWKQFKKDVQDYLDTYGVEPEEDLS